MYEIDPALSLKYDALRDYIRSFGSIAVAFSGGVDSTLLLKVSHDVLGDKAFAVTARSGSFPHREMEEADEFCRANGIEQIVCRIDEMSIPGFSDNRPDRCYLCKHRIFETLIDAASKKGASAVAEGSNTDDDGDYRPGMIAIRELGVLSPLHKAGLSKADIRKLSHMLGLPTWNKPSAACLASRFVYGEKITSEKLDMVDKAETLLHDMDFCQVRVRIHGDSARIETSPGDFQRFCNDELRSLIYSRLRSFGFSYVSLDLKGYRTGSMNEVLTRDEMKLE
ncbi:MAG: ATP-dependent sacrificial sulfur transferase LarE [Clostridiales bacterium]|nr:ATP-dependent sacrificial sulfur transferase LarE [Clostridiales bacterium]